MLLEMAVRRENLPPLVRGAAEGLGEADAEEEPGRRLIGRFEWLVGAVMDANTWAAETPCSVPDLGAGDPPTAPSVGESTSIACANLAAEVC